VDVDGLIVVDKPGGMTSHDVVARIRRLAKTRRVGHGGTLDPMATGVLIIGVNRATRLLTYVIGSAKSYTATIRLGQSTITDDAEGDVIASAPTAAITDDAIRTELARQVGEIDQIPSAVSAIKINGQRAYKRVRDGESVEIPARRITIHRLETLDIRRTTTPAVAERAVPSHEVGTPASGAEGTAPAQATGVAVTGQDEQAAPLDVIDIDIDVTCSSGTYIRAIARDLGTALGVGGHLTALRRTAVGGLTLAEASTLPELEERAPDVISLPMAEAAARAFPRRDATEDEARTLRHGAPLSPVGIEGPYAVFAPTGTLLAIVRERAGQAHPEIVLSPT
jgi:tRNA pseudouridine55 synthase